MKLILIDEVNTNNISVTSYYSTSGTIASPLTNVKPKPEKRLYKASNVGVRVYELPVPNVTNLFKRTVELIDLVTGHPITSVDTDTLDSNSTNYSSNMDVYFTNLITAVTAYYP